MYACKNASALQIDVGPHNVVHLCQFLGLKHIFLAFSSLVHTKAVDIHLVACSERIAVDTKIHKPSTVTFSAHVCQPLKCWLEERCNTWRWPVSSVITGTVTKLYLSLAHMHLEYHCPVWSVYNYGQNVYAIETSHAGWLPAGWLPTTGTWATVNSHLHFRLSCWLSNEGD